MDEHSSNLVGYVAPSTFIGALEEGSGFQPHPRTLQVSADLVQRGWSSRLNNDRDCLKGRLSHRACSRSEFIPLRPSMTPTLILHIYNSTNRVCVVFGVGGAYSCGCRVVGILYVVRTKDENILIP